MIAYADSSAILRRVLPQPGAIADWDKIERLICGRLVEVECNRTLDRLRITQTLSLQQLERAREDLTAVLAHAEFVEVSPMVLRNAGAPMPVVLGTLDAIHFATARLWQDQHGLPLTMATHDTALADAARLHGMPVLG